MNEIGVFLKFYTLRFKSIDWNCGIFQFSKKQFSYRGGSICFTRDLELIFSVKQK